MNNQDKMRNQLRMAEAVQVAIEKVEKQVLATFSRDPRNVGQGALAQTAKFLDEDHGYRSLVGRRTAHQTQAIMYGVAALVDAIRYESASVD